MIALPLIVICGVFLTLDLHRPERFWHMLFRSEVVHEAIAQGWPTSGAGWRTMTGAPLLKYWSPMSVGSWAISLFGLCHHAFTLGLSLAQRQTGTHLSPQLVRQAGRPGRLLHRLLRGGLYRRSAHRHQPAALERYRLDCPAIPDIRGLDRHRHDAAARSRRTTPESVDRLEKADLWALGLELLFFVLFLASIGSLLVPVLKSWHGLALVAGTCCWDF